jgi:uncharacterized protein
VAAQRKRGDAPAPPRSRPPPERSASGESGRTSRPKSKFLVTKKLTDADTEMPRAELHCFRCGHVWRPRKSRVHLCARCKSPYYWYPKLVIPTFGGGLGIEELIGDKAPDVVRVARKCGARAVRIFGSVARRSAGPESDIDVLIEPIPHRKYRPIDLALELRELLGRRVDVVSEGSLHRLVQPRVLTEAVPL